MDESPVRVGQIWVDNHLRHAQILSIEGALVHCHTWFEGIYDPRETTLLLTKFGGAGPSEFRLSEEAETDADA